MNMPKTKMISKMPDNPAVQRTIGGFRLYCLPPGSRGGGGNSCEPLGQGWMQAMPRTGVECVAF